MLIRVVSERTLYLETKPCAYIWFLEFFRGQKYKNCDFFREIEPAQPQSLAWLLAFTTKTFTQFLRHHLHHFFQRFFLISILSIFLMYEFTCLKIILYVNDKDTKIPSMFQKFPLTKVVIVLHFDLICWHIVILEAVHSVGSTTRF